MKKLVALFAVLSVATGAWAAGGSSSVGPANPASVLCVEMGGDLEIVSTPGGEAGFCTIEEWHLYHELEQRGRLPDLHFGGGSGPIGMPNPASVVCEKIGGDLTIRSEEGGEAGHCTIEEWALYHYIHQ